MKLERMAEFFEARLEGYDRHMLDDIEGAAEFYPFTAEALPQKACDVLDLGCGTGLELEFYFEKVPTARIVGVDLSRRMLEALDKKFHQKNITLVCGSYFDVEPGENVFDAAVSVESLHHFSKDEKTLLYRKLHRALKNGGYFVLTDYFASSDEEEKAHRDTLLKLRREQGVHDSEVYHYDTPLTLEHEMQALVDAGFDNVRVLKSWGATSVLKAEKQT